MERKDCRRFWQSPWGYRESIAVVGGVVVVGWMLQWMLGGFNFYLLAAPVNLYFGGFIVALCALSLLVGKRPLHAWFSGISFSITLISFLLLLTLIMGLTPQTQEPAKNIFSRLGLTQMTSSWPFVLVYFLTLLSLGCLIARKLSRFRWKDYAFYMNHLGLWLVLFAAGLGYADMERYIMHVREGETEWRVYDDETNLKELQIALQLNDFDMEEYPPKLTVIDRQTGIPQPESNPDYYQIDIKSPDGQLNGWDIRLSEYIHQAVRSSDSTYRETPMPGATPAARIEAVNRATGETREGWVCGGNQAQLYMTLPLDDQFCVVMTQPEPKRFVSDVVAYTPDGTVKPATLEVNKPLRVGNWTVYQYGYDNAAGRLSTYSSMELVYDPWIVPVYIGFLLIAIGSFIMLWKGKKTAGLNNKNGENV